MLFDLRGKRKRLIQVVYLLLAIVFAASTVIFFVGSGFDFSGSLFDVLGSGQAGSGAAEDDVKRYEKTLRRQPKNKKILLKLVRAEYSVATSGDNYDQETGQFKKGAEASLKKSTKAWQRYLKLEPERVSITTASLVVRAYEALGSYEEAAETQEVIVEEDPSSNGFYQLAAYAYFAGQIKKGDLAAMRSVDLAKKRDRKGVKRRLDNLKEQAQQQLAQDAQSKTPAPEGSAPEAPAPEAPAH